MSGKWRQLIPHILGMLFIYIALVTFVAVTFGQQSFWISLMIALLIAFGYPHAVRRLDIAPEIWQ